MEKYGSGITRIIKAFAEYGLTTPVFEDFQHGFRVVISKTTQKTTTREQIIDVLRQNSHLTRGDLAAKLSKSPNTIKEHIANLKSAGKIKRVGTDRNGYWEIE